MLAQPCPAEQTLGMRALRQTPRSVLQWLTTQLLCYPAMGFVSCWSPRRKSAQTGLEAACKAKLACALAPLNLGTMGPSWTSRDKLKTSQA